MTSSISSKSTDNKLEGLNHTELYQTCLRAGFKVHPGSDRGFFIAVLMGEEQATPIDEESHPIDSWRIGIIEFLREHWAVVEPQLTCPAKNLGHPTNPNPRPCFGCVDAQVIECVTKNDQRVELLIDEKRPKGKL